MMHEGQTAILRKVDQCRARYRSEKDQENLKNTRAKVKMLFIKRESIIDNPHLDDLVKHARMRIKMLEEQLATDRDMDDQMRAETFGAIDTWIEVIGLYDVAQIDSQLVEISRTLDRYVEND